MRSGMFKVYKSKGAAQFNIIGPQWNSKGFIEREGCVFMEVAPGDGNKDNPTWDWAKEKKIVFALGLADIAMMLDTTKGKIDIVHEKDGLIKKISIVEGQDRYQGTYMLQVNEGNPKEGGKSVMVPFSNGEFNLLMRLLGAAAPLLINWTSDIYVQG